MPSNLRLPNLLFELEPEAGEAFAHESVEDLPVLLDGIRVERRRVALSELDELIPSRVHEVEIIAVARLRLVAFGFVVGAQRGFGVPYQPRALPFEEGNLTLDEIDEATAAKRHQLRTVSGESRRTRRAWF
jgi:hypothetical protein